MGRAIRSAPSKDAEGRHRWPDEKPWGAGEPSAAVIPAAIANQVYDAIGVRVRQCVHAGEGERGDALDLSGSAQAIPAAGQCVPSICTKPRNRVAKIPR